MSQTSSPLINYDQVKDKRSWVIFQELTSGMLAGSISKLVIAPLERIQLILQTQNNLKIPQADKYLGISDALMSIPIESI